MSAYEFVTVWNVAAPIKIVWDEIYNSQLWPTWWKGVESVEELRQGDLEGVGNVRRYTWKSKLPYRLTFEMRAVRVEPPSLLEGIATGQLDGRGLWRLTSDRDVTVARYEWTVQATKRWMRLLTPVARPMFEWNHDVVMSWGAHGLAKRLGVRVVEQKALKR